MEKRKLAGLVISCVLLLVLVVALIGAFRAAIRSSGWPKHTNPGLGEVSRIIGVQLSQYRSCRLVGSDLYEAGQGHTMLAKAEMSRSDARRLLSKYEDDTVLERSGTKNRMFSEHPPSWWDPDSVHKFATISCGDRGVTVVLIGMDRPDKAVLYISWSM